MTRICIVGPARCGKTTLARTLPGPVRHTDDLIGAGPRVECSVAEWLSEPGPWVIEGVAVTRGLREWLRQHPHGAPCDTIHRQTRPLETYTKQGQTTQAKGESTVWSQIEFELQRRGVVVRER